MGTFVDFIVVIAYIIDIANFVIVGVHIVLKSIVVDFVGLIGGFVDIVGIVIVIDYFASCTFVVDHRSYLLDFVVVHQSQLDFIIGISFVDIIVDSFYYLDS